MLVLALVVLVLVLVHLAVAAGVAARGVDCCRAWVVAVVPDPVHLVVVIPVVTALVVRVVAVI